MDSQLSNRFNDCDINDLTSIEYLATPISAIRIVGSILSMCGATSIIIAVFLTGKLSNPEVHPLFALSVGDFILSCMWLFGGAVWLDTKNEQSELHNGLGLCYVLAIATTMINIVTSLLTVVYALHALIRMREIVKNKGHISEKPPSCYQHIMTGVLYVACWCSPLLLVLPVTETKIGLSMSNDACWCFVDFFNTRPVFANESAPTHLSMVIATYTGVTVLLSSITIIIMYGVTLWLAWKVLKHQKAHHVHIESKANKVIKKLIFRAFGFIGIYIVCNLPMLAASISVWHEKTPLTLEEHSDKFILFWQSIFAPLQGILNALLYGWSRKEFRRVVLLPLTKLRQRQRVSDQQTLIRHCSSNENVNTHYQR